jgi:hypothetical protein
MKSFKLLLSFGVLLLVLSSAHAVEGYKDVYLDRDQDIIIHSIFCGDLRKIKSLKPSYVYTNTAKIDDGTYYYGSGYGNYSLTFKSFEGQPEQLKKRALLKAGQTEKSQMEIDECLVAPVAGLPPLLLSSLKQTIVAANDPNWGATMDQYAMVASRPAFGDGVYDDPRANAVNNVYDQKVYDANQEYLEATVQHFTAESQKQQNKLPKKLEDAIKYALQENRANEGKIYPAVEKPLVWTETSKKMYDDAVSRQRSEKAWDKLIQENFDWLFSIIGEDNDLESTQLVPAQPPEWNGQILEQVVTVAATFDDGKSLELDFVITSGKVDRSIFDSFEDTAYKSLSARKSMIAGTKKVRDLIDPARANTLDVYSPTSKINLFFSPFRANEEADLWRYR